MPIEGIQQLHLQNQARSLSDRSLLDKTEILIDVEIVAYLARHAWNVSELEIAVVASRALAGLLGAKDAVCRLVLAVKRRSRLERTISWVLCPKQAIELAVDVRIGPIHNAMRSQIAERIDLSGTSSGTHETRALDAGKRDAVIPAGDAIRASEGGWLPRLIALHAANSETADESTHKAIAATQELLVLAER